MCAQRYIDWNISGIDTERPLGYRVEIGHSRELPSASLRSSTFDSWYQFQYSSTGREQDLSPYPRAGIDSPSVGGLVRFDLRGESPQRSLIYINGSSIRRVAADSREVMATNDAVLLDPQSVSVDLMRNEVWVLDSTMVVAVLDSWLNLSRTIQMGSGTVAVVVDGARGSFWQVLEQEVRLRSLSDGSTLRSLIPFGGKSVRSVIASCLSRHTGSIYLSLQFSDLSYAFVHVNRIVGSNVLSLFVSDISEWTSGSVLLSNSTPIVSLYTGAIGPVFTLAAYGITVDRLASDTGDVYVVDRTKGRISKIAAGVWTPTWTTAAHVADKPTLDLATSLDAGVSDNRLVDYWSSDAVGAVRDVGSSVSDEGVMPLSGGAEAFGELLSGFTATPVWVKASSCDGTEYESSSSSSS